MKCVLYPVLLALSLGGVYAGIEAGFAPGLVVFVQSASNLVVIAALEVVYPRRGEWRLFSDGGAWADFAHSISGSVLGGDLGRSLGRVLVAVVAGAASNALAIGLWPESWPGIAQLVLVVLILDLIGYWYHRLMHEVPAFWPFHLIHHQPDRMHVLKSGRVHWFSTSVVSLLKFGAAIVLGIPGELLLWYAACTNIFGTLSHANIRMEVPRFVHYFVNTADVHHLHHSLRMDEGNSNYGNIVSVWDVVFGTFIHPHDRDLKGVGVEHDPLPRSYWKQLYAPFVESWRVLRSAAAARRVVEEG